MTKEEYLKGLLLAGMYVSNVRSNPQPSTFGRSVERERQRLLSLPELARLQQPIITGQFSWGELSPETWLSNTVTAFHHAHSKWDADEDDWSPNRIRTTHVGSLGSFVNDPLV